MDAVVFWGLRPMARLFSLFTAVKSSVILKTLLRNDAIPALTAVRPYFSMVELRAWLTRRRIPWSAATLNSYLHSFTNEGAVHDAGRGWYSILDKPLVFDRGEVEPVAGLIEKSFPFLSFAVWSTQQINPWMHHLLGRFVTFVHVESVGVATVWELLRDEGYDAYRNPGRREAKAFAVRDRTVVVRVGGLSQAPLDGHFARPEKILVDLVAEVDELPLMDRGELAGLFANVLTAGRLEINAMLNYAVRKRLKKNVLKYINQSTSQN